MTNYNYGLSETLPPGCLESKAGKIYFTPPPRSLSTHYFDVLWGLPLQYGNYIDNNDMGKGG